MGHPPPAALKEWQYLRTGARNQKVSLDTMACNPPVSLDSMKLGSIYIHPELMGEVKLVKFTPYMVILDGGSVWKFWPYWSIFPWIQSYRITVHIHVCDVCVHRCTTGVPVHVMHLILFFLILIPLEI